MWLLTRWMASTAAHRTKVLPCLSVAVVSVKLTMTPWSFLIFSASVGVRRVRCWGQGSGEARPRSGREGLDADTAGSAQHVRGGEAQISWWSWLAPVHRAWVLRASRASGAPAYLGARTRQSGDKMVIGVSR